MTKYQLFSPDTEVIGQALMDFEEAVGSEHFSPFLKKHGFTDLESEKWYPAAPWVAVLNDIANSNNSMFNFVSIGMKQIENLMMPPEMNELSLIEKLHLAEEIYKMNYRGTDVGDVRVEVLGESHVKISIRAFEPDDLWYGSAYGFMKRFAPAGTNFKVYYDTDVMRREQGGEITIIHVEW